MSESAATTAGAPGGFVDIHAHGGGGGTVEDGLEGIARMRAAHAAHGTTRQLLSLVANPVDRLVASLGVIREAMADDPSILGAHLEGPFLSPDRRGAHDPEHLIAPDPATVERLLAAGEGVLRMITIAPELPGALDAIPRFVAAGVVVAVGHTEASAGVARAAFDAGATVLTHAFNAMPGILGRAPGPLGAALVDERVTIEVIADGIHVDPVNLRWLFAAAPGRIAAITDAMGATGVGDGDYRLGGLDVEVRGGRATVAGTGQLAGSTLTLDRAVEILVAAGVPREAALAAATTVPARVLGLS